MPKYENARTGPSKPYGKRRVRFAVPASFRVPRQKTKPIPRGLPDDLLTLVEFYELLDALRRANPLALWRWWRQTWYQHLGYDELYKWLDSIPRGATRFSVQAVKIIRALGVIQAELDAQGWTGEKVTVGNVDEALLVAALRQCAAGKSRARATASTAVDGQVDPHAPGTSSRPSQEDTAMPTASTSTPKIIIRIPSLAERLQRSSPQSTTATAPTSPNNDDDDELSAMLGGMRVGEQTAAAPSPPVTVPSTDAAGTDPDTQHEAQVLLEDLFNALTMGASHNSYSELPPPPPRLTPVPLPITEDFTTPALPTTSPLSMTPAPAAFTPAPAPAPPIPAPIKIVLTRVPTFTPAPLQSMESIDAYSPLRPNLGLGLTDVAPTPTSESSASRHGWGQSTSATTSSTAWPGVAPKKNETDWFTAAAKPPQPPVPTPTATFPVPIQRGEPEQPVSTFNNNNLGLGSSARVSQSAFPSIPNPVQSPPASNFVFGVSPNHSTTAPPPNPAAFAFPFPSPTNNNSTAFAYPYPQAYLYPQQWQYTQPQVPFQPTSWLLYGPDGPQLGLGDGSCSAPAPAQASASTRIPASASVGRKARVRAQHPYTREKLTRGVNVKEKEKEQQMAEREAMAMAMKNVGRKVQVWGSIPSAMAERRSCWSQSSSSGYSSASSSPSSSLSSSPASSPASSPQSRTSPLPSASPVRQQKRSRARTHPYARSLSLSPSPPHPFSSRALSESSSGSEDSWDHDSGSEEEEDARSNKTPVNSGFGFGFAGVCWGLLGRLSMGVR